MTDIFHGSVLPKVEISRFASLKNPVDSGHDAFHEKSGDRPAVSNFKTTHAKELVFDQFSEKIPPNRAEDYSDTYFFKFFVLKNYWLLYESLKSGY